jgi:hypothetical protein
VGRLDEQGEENALLFAHVLMKIHDHLPRQARYKHKENGIPKWRFSQGTEGPARGLNGTGTETRTGWKYPYQPVSGCSVGQNNTCQVRSCGRAGNLFISQGLFISLTPTDCGMIPMRGPQP